MGAILLTNRKKSSFRTERSLRILSAQLSSKPVKYISGSWDIHYYSKMVSCDEPQIMEGPELTIICGTAIVPHKTHRESLHEIHESLNCYQKPPDNLIGNYLILFADESSMKLFTDPMNLYSTYITVDNSAISTSFLALAAGVDTFTLNRNALTENLVTGSIIGIDTISSEIHRLNNDISFGEDGLKFIPQPVRYSEIPRFKSRKDSQEQIMRKLDDHFRSFKPFAEEHGIDTGLTGGYDSRFLLALAMKHFSHQSIQVHSHSRNKCNIDLDIAQKISREMDFPLHTVPVRDLSNSTLNSIVAIMERSMIFNDGQFRANSYWYEEYNTEQYRRKILKDKTLGFTGIGGEIFRNQERSWAINKKLSVWIKYNVIRHYAGDIFSEPSHEKDLLSYLHSKLNRCSELDLDSTSNISNRQKKIYFNHIYLQAGRGARVNSENRLGWFLCPFTDPSLTIAAMGTLPFQGISMDYESELINIVNPKLAKITSSYGYNFAKGEPFSKYFPKFIVENFLPSNITNRLKMFRHSANNYKRQCSDPSVFEYFKHMAAKVADLDLPVETNKLLMKPDLSHLVISAGFFLDRLHNGIR